MHFKRGENTFTEKNVFRIAILHFIHMIYFLSTRDGFSRDRRVFLRLIEEKKIFTFKNVFLLVILHKKRQFIFCLLEMGFPEIEGFSCISSKKKKFLHLKMYFL
jgi:hypothetical protein